MKHGGVDLTCELDDDHEPGWHRAVFTDRRELTYQGAHHVVETTETVTWEPLDHAKEAVRMLMKNRRRDGARAAADGPHSPADGNPGTADGGDQ